MIDLSVTAIGQRTLAECLAIYEELKPSLSLEFLELAIGTRCDLSLIPAHIPLIVHHRCLYEGSHKLPFSLAAKETWKGYQERVTSRDVRLLSIHPPLRDEIDLDDLKRNRKRLESLLGIPVCLEVMPGEKHWLSVQDFLDQASAFLDIPLLLDLSHINIWASRKQKVTSRTNYTREKRD